MTVPSLHFVVSQAARDALNGLPGLAFAPVELEKVIYLPYDAGDFSYYDRPDFKRDPLGCGHDTVFRRWPDRPDLYATVGPRYEVIGGDDYLHAPAYPEGRMVELPDPSNVFESEVSPLCAQMMIDYSMVDTIRGVGFTLEAFQRVEQFLDPEYFAVIDVRID
jgi:hypothetical protein